MNEKRNQLITQAILDTLSTGAGIYTAEDILTAADIDNEDLQELLKQIRNNVAEMKKKEK